MVSMEVYSAKEPSKIIKHGVLKVAPVIGNSQTYFQKIKTYSVSIFDLGKQCLILKLNVNIPQKFLERISTILTITSANEIEFRHTCS